MFNVDICYDLIMWSALTYIRTTMNKPQHIPAPIWMFPPQLCSKNVWTIPLNDPFPLVLCFNPVDPRKNCFFSQLLCFNCQPTGIGPKDLHSTCSNATPSQSLQTLSTRKLPMDCFVVHYQTHAVPIGWWSSECQHLHQHRCSQKRSAFQPICRWEGCGWVLLPRWRPSRWNIIIPTPCIIAPCYNEQVKHCCRDGQMASRTADRWGSYSSTVLISTTNDSCQHLWIDRKLLLVITATKPKLPTVDLQNVEPTIHQAFPNYQTLTNHHPTIMLPNAGHCLPLLCARPNWKPSGTASESSLHARTAAGDGVESNQAQPVIYTGYNQWFYRLQTCEITTGQPAM